MPTRLEELATRLASLEAELSALSLAPMDTDEAKRVSALRNALPGLISFLRQEIVRHQANCARKEAIRRLTPA